MRPLHKPPASGRQLKTLPVGQDINLRREQDRLYRIKKHWSDQGYEIRAWIEPACVVDGQTQIYGIRSNLQNGLPAQPQNERLESVLMA